MSATNRTAWSRSRWPNSWRAWLPPSQGLTKMFDLASYLPYLVNRIGVRLAGAFGKELAAYGITLPMWRVLAALRHRGSQRVGRLAAATSIEVSTLSRLLAGMDRRGLVRR